MGLADGQQIFFFRHGTFQAIHLFAFHENHGVFIADGRFQQTLCISRIAWDNHFQARGIGIPVFKVLAVLLCQLSGTSGRSSEYHGTSVLSIAHAVHFGRSVNYLINGHQGEVEGHEFANWAQAVGGSTHGDTGKAKFCNGCVNNPFGTKFCEHALANLVGTVVFCNFFSEQKHALIAAHLFGHSLTQGFSELNFSHGCKKVTSKQTQGSIFGDAKITNFPCKG